jgi:hypothetical protein
MDSKSSAENRPVDRLVAELVSRWLPLFAGKDWPERLDLLHQVHEQLQEDLGQIELYSAVSPAFIRELLEGLSVSPITCVAQAHIYANSDDEFHRRLAGEWLDTYQPPDSLQKIGEP